MDPIATTASIIKSAYILAVVIRDSERMNADLKRTASLMTREFTIIGGVLEQWRNMAHRVDVNSEKILTENIKRIQEILNEAHKVLQQVSRNRSFFKRLLMNSDEYRKELQDLSGHLQRSCAALQSAVNTIPREKIPRIELADFRKIFRQTPEKKITMYDFAVIRDTPNSNAIINIDEFDQHSPCYMKISGETIIFSHQLRSWSTSVPKNIILNQRLASFRSKLKTSSTPNLSGIDSKMSMSLSKSSLNASGLAGLSNELNERLDFTEFSIAHDDICGVALTKEYMYIATQYELTMMSLKTQEIVAQFGSEGNDNNTFKQISYLYIPYRDENNLYVVDSGQHAVHHYKIDHQENSFEFVRRYVIIADVPEASNLISCVIYGRKLFVSDETNHCIHIFHLNGQRQAFYLVDNSMTPFSPGSLCVYDQHLYVANFSAEYPCILIFNEDCNLIDCFRNQSLKQILFMDICPNLHELFIVTINSVNVKGHQREQPLIATISPVINSTSK